MKLSHVVRTDSLQVCGGNGYFLLFFSGFNSLKIGERWWPIWGIITKDKKRQLCFGHIFLRYVKIWLKSCRRNDRESRLSIDTHIPVGVGTCL